MVDALDLDMEARETTIKMKERDGQRGGVVAGEHLEGRDHRILVEWVPRRDRVLASERERLVG